MYVSRIESIQYFHEVVNIHILCSHLVCIEIRQYLCHFFLHIEWISELLLKQNNNKFWTYFWRKTTYNIPDRTMKFVIFF